MKQLQCSPKLVEKKTHKQSLSIEGFVVDVQFSPTTIVLTVEELRNHCGMHGCRKNAFLTLVASGELGIVIH